MAKPDHNGGAEYERQDLGTKPVLGFLAGIAAVCVLAYFLLHGFYSALNSYENSHQPARGPLVQQTEANPRRVEPGEVAKFPQPRLETNEKLEINDFRLREEQTLNSYGWVGQPGGAVHIPIGQAMALVAQRGLPSRPQAAPAPPAAMNAAKQADSRHK